MELQFGALPEWHSSYGWRTSCGAFRVIRFGSSNFGYPGVAGSWHCDDLFYRAVARGSRFKGTQFTSAGPSYTRDDPAYTLPERLLDPVGVGNGVDRDYGLSRGHPAHLGVVVAHAGEDGRQHLPGLIGGDEPAKQGGKGGM